MAAGNVSIEASSWSREASEPAGSSGALPTSSRAPSGSDLDVELARARLDQAEQEMDSLKSRISYLEARAASSVGATARELEELMQVRDALGLESAGLGGLSRRLEQHTQESAALAWDSWDDY